MPSVSVVIPTYNYAKYIARSVESVVNQSFQDFEILVVDDGSTDNTREVIETKYKTKVRYFYQENSGAPSARNRGIEESKGDYLAFLDADDEWFPSKLEKQIDKFKSSADTVGLIYSGFAYIWGESEDKGNKIIPTLRGNIFPSFLKGSVLGSPTPVIRKPCFQKAGTFDETLPSSQDWDMWLRISKHYEVDFVPDVLAKHYIHDDQISERMDLKIQGIEMVIQKHHEDFSHYPLILSRHLCELGKLNTIMRNWKEACKYFWEAVKLDPLQCVKIPLRDGPDIVQSKLKVRIRQWVYSNTK